ncbi:MAG TPA: RluA family pseudouridine synthase, partial [Anaerolineaceae bacterium]|nr:RluA family pseudouridine synthase [Anaerolineaceae bacterium]
MLQGFPVENVIYQDADILVVNKPSGLLTIPDGYDHTMANLAALLSTQFGQVWVVHRLDKETSGLVLFALNPSAHQELNRQFRERLVQKGYLALAAPAPEWESQAVNLPLRVNAGRSHLTKVDFDSGKAAETTFRVLEKKPEACQLVCQPKTGYRHQIRAHLYSQGMAILGDVLYQPLKEAVTWANAPRLMLQAQALQFIHPTTNKSIAFELTIDPDLE